MKLYEIINTLQQIASAQPAVNNVFEGSVYQLNELKDIKYASVVISQEQHTQDRDFITYNFNIFYVDRLTADGSNKLSVQSTALDVLANIVLAMDELGFDFTNIYYNTFTQRFEAECAGAYATVSFLAPAELCADWYDIIVSNIRAEGNGYSILDKYATKEWVEDNFSGGTGGGVSPQEAQEMIDEAIDAETARTESTYLKEQSLSGYATEEWVREQGYVTGTTQINDAGNNYTPVYVSGGTVIPANLSIPGRRWGVPVYTNPNDGGVEGGSFLDFHNESGNSSDYSGRVQKRATSEGFSFMYETGGTETNTLAANEHFAVDSRNVIHIQEISQSDYDELVDYGEVNPFTLYLIPEE